VLLAAAATVLTAPGTDAIVVGDGLEVPSGRGPTDEPTRRWSTALGVTDPLPAVVAADTVVLAGRSRGSVRLVGLDRASGRRLWSASVAEGSPVAVTAVGRDVVVVGTTSGDAVTAVVRLAARTGNEVWTAPVVMAGTATSAVTLPTGRTVVAVDAAPDRTGQVLLVGDDGTVEVVAPARAVATSAAWIATLDGTTVTAHTPSAAPVSSIDVGPAPVTTLVVVEDLVVVAQGDVVRAFEVATGSEAWVLTVDAPVVGLAPSRAGVAVITTADHVGVGAAGEVLWRDPGFPLPLLRDGEDVTLLVAPGTETALELRLVDAGGGDVLRATADEGTYLALGHDVVLTGVGDDVLGTPLDGGGAPAWSVDTAGEVLWLVLDGGTMFAVSSDDGGTSVSRWA
jgi:outer membrane protein assembly factor BamB